MVTFVAENDIVLVVGPDKEVLEKNRKMARRGSAWARGQGSRRSRLRARIASRPSVIGRSISDLAFAGKKAVVIAQVRRGDTNILPRPDLVLEFGDRVGCSPIATNFAPGASFFGDSVTELEHQVRTRQDVGVAAGAPGR